MTHPSEIKKRLNILSVPIDVLPEEEFGSRIEELTRSEESHQIVLLGLWDFVRARGNSVFARTVRSASLVLPTSKSVQRIAWFLRKRHVPRHLPFDFVIRLLTTLESRRRSVYIIGSRPAVLQTATANVRGSFPDLQIVGRCAGYFAPAHENDIVLAIRKASPALVLAGNGLAGRDKWLFSHRDSFAPGLSLWAGTCIEMFAGRKKRTPRDLWSRGLDFIPDLIRHPWRLYRGFVYLWLVLVVLYYKIKKL